MSAKNQIDEEQYAAEATGSANASFTCPAQASALHKNGFVMLRSHPCKIINISVFKPGKYGHVKCNLEGKDIFTWARLEDMHRSSHNMDVPIVERNEYHVFHITRGGYLQLLNLDGLKEDVRCLEGEAGEKIKSLLAADKDTIVTILSAIGKEIVIDTKERSED